MRYYKYLLVGLLVAYSGFAMQPQENEDYLSSLPADLRAQIINYLTSGKTHEEVINNIRSLSRVNKSHYYLINDAQVTRYLISTIAKRFNINQLSVALKLGTLGSQDWANKYISEKQNDANFKQELAIVLQHAIKDNDLNLVKYIISKMPSLLNEYVLDPANGYKRTPLVQAIRY